MKKKSNHKQIYVKNNSCKPFQKPLPYRNLLTHFTYQTNTHKPIRLDKKNKQKTLCWSASAVLQLWDFETSHNLCLIAQQKTFSAQPEVSKDSLHICSPETALTPPPIPTWASVQRWRWLVSWRTPPPLTVPLMDPSVCLAWVSNFFFYTCVYIYI